ncbi:MAG TPA: hypothetical protein PKD63_10150, partial [Solirubrobacteraceae bacterium]|nr:hypothetical protein [Solirubrobacteraceae bacterium]
MRRPRRLVTAALAGLVIVLLAAAPAPAQRPTAFAATTPSIPVREPGMPPGAQQLTYRFGPMTIKPGQNLIGVDLQRERPSVNGWIVGFRPGLVNAADGKSPPVTEVHLHHAVWLVALKPTFAAGEEKTYINAPSGYGWRYTTKQFLVINHMVHDLSASPKKVYITYTMWFIPDTAPEAASIREISTLWMDVQGGKAYPVFDAARGSGTGGTLTYPDQVPRAYARGPARNRWVADRDATLVTSAGHLHPGGLWTDLLITRGGVTKRIFRSRANYFEPAGPVSWDVSMSATGPDWKVAVKKGDVISTTATYDTTRASWFEVMGIMVVGITNGADGGTDPFTGAVDQTDFLTHGRLPENADIGVRRPNPGLSNPLRLRRGPLVDRVVIRNFAFGQGDLTARGARGRPATVEEGRQLTFVNADAPLTIRFHTVTACRAPCNRTGGIGYPLADGRTIFDSGELGTGP